MKFQVPGILRTEAYTFPPYWSAGEVAATSRRCLLQRCFANALCSKHTHTHTQPHRGTLKYRMRMAILNCGELRESKRIIVVEILCNVRKLWWKFKISRLKNSFGYCEHCTIIMFVFCIQCISRLFKAIRKIIHHRLARTLNPVSFSFIGFFDLYFYHSNCITKFYWDYRYNIIKIIFVVCERCTLSVEVIT